VNHNGHFFKFLFVWWEASALTTAPSLLHPNGEVSTGFRNIILDNSILEKTKRRAFTMASIARRTDERDHTAFWLTRTVMLQNVENNWTLFLQ